MTQASPSSAVATVTVVVIGILWGFYWMPVRYLQDAGLPGAWVTFGIALAATFVLGISVLIARPHVPRDWPTYGALALGGAAFAMYSVGFAYGRVAIVILLFFLTPVWSTLITRFILGRTTSVTRLAAIVIGLLGLFVMLGADGGVPLPRSIGDWLALASGICWSLSSTIIHEREPIKPLLAAFAFASGAAVLSGVCILALPTQPLDLNALTPPTLLITTVTGTLWWSVSMAGLMWATALLDPARVGILLMSEVLIGALSAAFLVGEPLLPFELIGGALVLSAAILEVWPTNARQP
jgi:drug/metabolite transporter (DMT)-like permease